MTVTGWTLQVSGWSTGGGMGFVQGKLRQPLTTEDLASLLSTFLSNGWGRKTLILNEFQSFTT